MRPHPAAHPHQPLMRKYPPRGTRALLVIKRACLLDADWQRSVIADKIFFTTMASRFVEANGTLILFRECNSLKNFALYVIKK